MKKRWFIKGVAVSLSLAMAFTTILSGSPGITAKAASTVQASDEESDNVFASMRKKFFDMAVGGDYDPEDPTVQVMLKSINETAQLYWDKLNKSPVCNAVNGSYMGADGKTDTSLDSSRDYIFAEYPLGHRSESSYMNANSIHFTFQYLRAMALAYQTKGCELYKNEDMLRDIKDAVEYTWQNHYNGDSTVKYGNWFSWELGAPIYFGELLILLYDEYDQAEIQKYVASTRKFLKQSGYTSANATWCMRAHMYGAILSEDESYFAVIKKTMPEVLQYTTSGDGYYTDGTFVQHTTHTYNGGYGLMCLTDTALLFYMLAGTQWDPGQENAELVYQWVKDSYEPMVYNGLCMDAFRGREITRTDTTQPRGGLVIANAMLMLAETAPEETAAQFKSVIKQWFSNEFMVDQLYNSADTPWYKFPLDTVVKVTDILEDDSITPVKFDGNTFQMNAGARTVHWSKEGWAYTIAMSSKRIQTYEVGDSNARGWYLGNGATYLYTNDIERYESVQKPTLDWYRLPGATAIYGKSQGTQYNQQSFVGGVTDGVYGVSGMDMAFTNGLSAKKSWFMFDNEVVALGSNINGQNQVETTLENYMLDESNRTYTVDGNTEEMTMDGNEISYSGISTLHMQGNAENSDIGFYFPNGEDFKVKSETRKGTWRALGQYNTDSSEQQADYFTVWKNHSQNGKAENGSYAYVLLPNMTEGQTQAYASDSDVEILQQDDRAHAVYEKNTGILGVNFWQDGYNSLDLGEVKNYLTCDSAATVMVTENDNGMAVSVADTTWENPGYINLEINRAAKGIIQMDDGVEVLQTSPSIKLRVNVKNAMGKSFQVKFSYDSVELQPVAITKAAMSGEDLEVSVEKSANADSYLINIGTESGKYTKTVETEKNVVTLYGLTPGETYYLAAQVKKGNDISEMGQEISFTMPGITEFHDEFEGFDKMLSYTSGWGLDAGDGGKFNNDVTRIKRTSNTTQSFSYMLPGLQSFSLEVYGYDYDLGTIKLYTSEDGVEWTEQDYAILGTTPSKEWFKDIISTPDTGVNKGANYLKVEVVSHTTKVWAPQFTKFDATMRSNSDRKTVKDTLLNDSRIYDTRNVTFAVNENAEMFGGDTDVVRAADTDNELLYSWTNIQDVQVTAYVRDEGALLASVSEDGESFNEIEMTAAEQDTDSVGYTKTVYTISCAEEGTDYLKLGLQGDIVLSDVTLDYKPDNAPVQKLRFAEQKLDGVIQYDAVPQIKTAPMNGQSELIYTTDNSSVAKYNNGTLQFVGQGETNARVRVSGTEIEAILPLTVYKDICLGKPVTASSTSAGYPVANAVDTDTTVTRWQSQGSNGTEWLQVDMGEGASFDAVDIQWYSNGEDYELLISDNGTDWTAIKEVTGQKTGKYVRYDFDETLTARYLKMQGVSASQYSLFSIRALQKVSSGEIEVEPWNLALGKNASCSSYDKDDQTQFHEKYAVDGNASTRWASQRSDDQWYMVDLGETSTVTKVNILWEAAAGKEYKVQISDDGETWTDMIHEKNNTSSGWKNYILPEKYTGRYVRMLGISRVGQYGYSMYEFEVMGTNASATTVQKIDEISLSQTEMSILKDQSARLTAITKPEVNSISVGWKSSDPELVSVSDDGTITAKGSSGTAVITAYSFLDESVKAECSVTITPYSGEFVKVTSVKIAAASEKVFLPGSSCDLTAEILPENASNKRVSWTSSNPEVAVINSKGHLTALAAGKTVITVQSVASGLTDEMEIEVRDVDKEAAEEVIRRINEISEVTLEAEGAITEVRKAYDALTDTQKTLVGEIALKKLTDAESMLAKLKEELADQMAAAEVTEKIGKIGIVVLESETVIREARKLYDSLTETQKALVTNLDVLSIAEGTLDQLKTDKAAADAAAELIDRIGEVNYESKQAIETARRAFDGLTASQRGMVENLDKLTTAEQLYAAMTAGDQGAANVVKGMIEGLTDIDAASRNVIEAVRAAYDALTSEQKTLVINVSILEKAEADIIGLENQAAADKAAALISELGEVTLENTFKVELARTVYDALTEEQKILVTNVSLLEKAEADIIGLENQAAADKAAALISELGEVTLENTFKVELARTVYDALTEEQKALVGNVGTLTDAESRIAQLKKEREDEQAKKEEEEKNRAAANEVIIQISRIGVVSIDSKEVIEAARAAYETLTEAAKALVENAEDLENAEKALTDLLNQKPEEPEKPEEPQKPVPLVSPVVKSVKSTASKKAAGRVKITVEKAEAGQTVEVYRRVGTSVKLIGTTAGTSVYDNAPVSGKKADYYAKAVSRDITKYLDSADSEAVSITLPADVKSIKVKAIGRKQVRITWSKGKGAGKYFIYRSTKKDSGYVRIASVKASKRSYIDKKAKAGKKYYYKVVTKKNAKFSAGKTSKAVKVKK